MSLSRIFSTVPSNLANNVGYFATVLSANTIGWTNLQPILSQANSASANTIYTFGVDNTQNTRLNLVEANTIYTFGVDNTQNTRLNLVEANTIYLFGALNQTNNNIVSANSQLKSYIDGQISANVSYISGVDTAQNNRLSLVEANTIYTFGVDNTQNTNISNLGTWLSSNVAYSSGINNTQNTNIQSSWNTANTGYNFIVGGGTVTGNVSINGNLNVTGNIVYVGNSTTQIITGNTGEFFGATLTGFDALYAGVPALNTVIDIPYTVIQSTANYNGYAQVNHININSGANASGDYIVTADNGSANDTFIDLGINSSNYNQPGFTLNNPNDGYLYVYGNTATGGGNLIVATMTNNDIIFATSGQNTNNEQGRFKNGVGLILKQTTPAVNTNSGALQIAGGAGISGNVYANNVYAGNTNVLSFANSAYTAANSAYNQATSAYNAANSALSSALAFAIALG